MIREIMEFFTCCIRPLLEEFGQRDAVPVLYAIKEPENGVVESRICIISL